MDSDEEAVPPVEVEAMDLDEEVVEPMEAAPESVPKKRRGRGHPRRQRWLKIQWKFQQLQRFQRCLRGD